MLESEVRRAPSVPLRPSAHLLAALACVPALMLGEGSARGAPQTAHLPATGVLIVEVHPTGAGAAAGLLPDDLLVSWARLEPASQDTAIEEIAGWLWLAEVESPAGPVRLAGERRGAPFEVELPPGRWGITVRPRLEAEGAAEAALLAALSREPPPQELLEGPEVARRLEDLLADAGGRGDAALVWWLALRRGEADFAEGRLEEAEQRLGRAVEVAEAHGLPLPRILALDRLAAVLEALGRREEAEARLREAAGIAETSWGESLPLARALFSLGFHLSDREHLGDALELLGRAVELRERLAPGSLELATALDRQGIATRRRGDGAGAMALHLRALEIRRSVDPGGTDTAITLNSLGLAAWRQGDLDAAGRWLAEAREHLEASEPESPILISVVSNLGLVARERGELLQAERHLMEALELEEARGARGSDRRLAIVLNSLGMVAADRGDLAAAADHYGRSLGLFEGLAPGGRPVAMIAVNLGLIALDQGELDDAERLFRQAQAIEETIEADSMRLAFLHNNLGKLFYARNDLEAAKEHYHHSLEIKERLAPGTMTTANTLANIGHLARQRGDLATARSHYQRALEIRTELGAGGVFEATALADLGSLATEAGDHEEAAELLEAAREVIARLAPGSMYAARTLRFLGELHRARGDLDASSRAFEEALDALELQVGKLPGGEGTRARYRARHLGFYREAIEVLLELGRAEEAFQALERSRARMLVEMLAERDLLFSADIPEELAEAQHRKRREIEALHERLAAADPRGQAEEITELQEELSLALRRRDELVETVRRTSPRLAALRYPRPLDAAGARKLLEPGTLLLSFSVSPSGTDVFVLTREDLRVVRLPIGEEELRDEVEWFRRLVQRGRLERETPGALVSQGERLWQLLLAPLEPELSESARLLISPDGPLHLLPFAALVRSGVESPEASEGPVFLASTHPVAVVLSASLLEELRLEGGRRPERPRLFDLAAFGDPLGPGPAGETGAAPAPGLVPRHALTPLPGSRAEVQALARRFGSTARPYLGPAATEGRAREMSGRARYLHFATHGVLNELFPLSSGLVLAGDEAHDGLLQAWEIFEDLRLNADLVTLSACETALGAELRGEGLVGLTRAFQHAGARGVLASLWRVADISTATLMDHVYGGLAEGRPPARALADAQRRLLDDPDTAHPYHWAGFVLYGDWR